MLKNKPTLDMKRVSVQLQLDRLPPATFRAKDERSFWQLVKNRLETSGFGEAAIVVCEGAHGWDDYLLLHSFEQPSTEKEK